MTDNEQIEQMASVLLNECYNADDCSSKADCDICRADKLYTSGYRKDSEVAREIIQDIVEPIWRASQNSENEMTSLLAAFICEYIATEIKNKYTEVNK